MKYRIIATLIVVVVLVVIWAVFFSGQQVPDTTDQMPLLNP